ncbi:MAG: zinc ribbon domain-containing protein [Acidobacteriota bacterium]|nr:zinc ribbon domain-containing protein [Acidobacteriota bacterium]
MAVKTLQARLHCEPKKLEALWRTHEIFNERLKDMLSLLFRMRRGECGRSPDERELYREIALFITGCPANNAPYLLNSVCIQNWVPTTARKIKAIVSRSSGELIKGTEESWATRAAQLSAKGHLLFDKREVFGDLTPAMAQVIVREAAAYLSSYESHVRRWERKHEQWLGEKAAWEAEPEHQLYLASRPRFTAFEAGIGGRLTERRHRWAQYLTWLSQNPELAAWRGGLATINPIGEEGRKRIAHAPRWRKAQVEAEEFFKLNPELKDLDALHGYYERKFVRRRKTKRHIDGFDHKPTFTQPDALVHPHWYLFNGPQTKPAGYRKLILPKSSKQAGSIELSLMTCDKNDPNDTAWVPFRFHGDCRMSNFRSVVVTSKIKSGGKRGQTKEKEGYEMYDPALKTWRPAEVKGARLIFTVKGKRPRAAYLYFTIKTKNTPFSEAARNIEWSETGKTFEFGKPCQTKLVPKGLVTCAAHIGALDCVYATLAVGDGSTPHIIRQRNLWIEQIEATGQHVGRRHRGPTLAHLASHKTGLSRRRSQMGRIPRGEAAHEGLQSHITNMAKDRYRQQARRIFDFALNVEGTVDPRTGKSYPRADVLILESMENLIPNVERKRGVNNALVAFNRAHLVSHLKDIVAEAGVMVFEISPVGTSQVCSRCGALGRPYSVRRRSKDQPLAITFGPAEPLFACPSCHYRANSSHNASVNLHHRFYSDQALESFITYLRQPVERKLENLRRIEAELTSPIAGPLSLYEMHGIKIG